MEQAPPPPILVRVSPRLLGDALSVALREQGLVVHTYPAQEPRSTPCEPRAYAVAVVTGSVPVDVNASEVIEIDQTGAPYPPAEIDLVDGAVPWGGAAASFEQLLSALQAALGRATA